MPQRALLFHRLGMHRTDRWWRALHPLAAGVIWGQMKELLGDDAEFLVTGHVRGVYDEAQAAVVEQYAKDARG